MNGQNAMTAELYNADGDVVEGAKTPDEIAELQKRSDTRKEQREALETEKQELQENLLKLSDKDMNFGKLKEKTRKKEEDIEKKEKEIEEAQKVFVKRQTYEYEQDAMVELGIDKEEREKVLHCFNNELTTDAVTKGEIKEKMAKAYKLVVKPSGYNPINAAASSEGYAMGGGRAESSSSKDMRQALGTSDDDAKKYGDGWKPKF